METRHIVKKSLSQKQDIQRVVYGTLGNQNGVVNVPDRPNYSYVMIDGHLVEVFNTRVAAKPGLGVMVGYDPNQPSLLQVLSVRPIERTGATPANQAITQKHHASHEWLSPDGGDDIVYVQLRQIMPLRPMPAGGYLVSIQYDIQLINDAWMLVGGTTVDLSSQAGSLSSDEEMFALISLSLSTGELAITAGSAATLGDLALSDIPETPSGHKPICAVRLYYGQAAIVEARTHNDLVDLRWAMVGTIGQGRITVAEADGTPSVSDVTQVTVGNGDLSDEGGGVVRLLTPSDYIDNSGAAQGYGLMYDAGSSLWTAFDMEQAYLKTDPNAVNTETLSGNKTLTDADATIQFLNPAATNRDVILPAAALTNHAFFITNTSNTWNYRITVKRQDTTVVTVISRGETKFFYSDGLTWVTNAAKDLTVANGSHYFVVDCDTTYDNFFSTKTAVNFETISSETNAGMTMTIKAKGTGTPGFVLKRSATDAFSIYNDGNTHIKGMVGSDMYFNQNLTVNWIVSYGSGGNPTYDFYGRRTADSTQKKLRMKVNTDGDACIWGDTGRNLLLGDNLATLLYLVSGKLGIGGTPSGKMHVTGTSDIVQAIIKGYSTQTNPIFEVIKNDDSVLVQVDNDGKITSASSSIVMNAKTLQVLADMIMDATGAASGQVLGYNGTKWVPTTPSGGGGVGAVNRVVAEDLVIQAGYGIIYPEWVEVADGYSIEIDDNAVLEVT